MKYLNSLLTLLALSTLSLQAEIHEDYNAPKLIDVNVVNLQANFGFTAPYLGGTVWEANISNDNPMGGLSLTEGSTSFYNGGLNGRELNEQPSANSFVLSTPQMTLVSGATYQLNYQSAGSRTSNNKTLAVRLSRAGQIVSTLQEAYELTPSLTYASQSVTFSVPENGEDYTLEFVVTVGSKTAGVGLMNISVSSPQPEGQGQLLGYNIWRNGESVHQFLTNETEEGAAYTTYIHTDSLSYSTEYTFQLQAVYEGGESPLSNSVTLTTREDPLTGIHAISTGIHATETYDLQGRRTKEHKSGLLLQNRKKTLLR